MNKHTEHVAVLWQQPTRLEEVLIKALCKCYTNITKIISQTHTPNPPFETTTTLFPPLHPSQQIMLAYHNMACANVSSFQLKFCTSRHPFSSEMTPCRPSPVRCYKHTHTPAALLSSWAQKAMLTRIAGGGKIYRVLVARDTGIIKWFARLNNSEFLTALYFSCYSFWHSV